MPVLTRLEAQKNNKERVNVYIDDEFFCGLLIDDVVRQKLAAGMQLTEAELANLRTVSDENRFFAKALEYLLVSPKTELQVKQYLYKKQVETNTVNSIIARLKTFNYINDEDYATNFARAKSDKYGKRVIRQKLASKGIRSDDIEVGDQSELALTLARKYMRNKERDAKEFSKLYRYLVGKGFDFDMVCGIVDKCKSE